MVTFFETLSWILHGFSSWFCFTLNWLDKWKDWAVIPLLTYPFLCDKKNVACRLSSHCCPHPPHPCLTTLLLLFETDFLTRSYLGHHILDTWTRSYIGHWECSSLVLTYRSWICKYEKCQGCYSCNNSLQFSAVIGETYPGFTSSPLGSPLCILPCFEDTFGDKFRTGTFLALTVLVTFLEWTAEQ